MKKYIRKISIFLAGLIVITPIANVGAISVKNIKLKDIVEEATQDKEPEDKEIDKDKDEDKESKYETDKDYMDAALKSIEWYKFSLDSDKDKNIVSHLKSKLAENGFSKVDIKLVNTETKIGNKEYINKDGDISYHYEDPELSKDLNKIVQASVKFELSKNDEKREYSKNINIGWDKPKVRKMIEENVFPLINDQLLRGENKDLSNIEKDLILPTKLKKYVSIEWESSNRLALDIKDQGFNVGNGKIEELPFLGKIKREARDQKLKLIAHIKFNHGEKPNETIHDKLIDITINGFDLPATRADMQKQLNEKYTLDKLEDTVTRKTIDPNKVVNDIALPTPRSTGVDKYFDYKFSARSNNKNIKILGYRAEVLRPLPGQEAYEATITVSMEERKNGVMVEKDFHIKVMPLSQEELDNEIKLMDLAKANYFNGIKGDNQSKDKVTKNLKKFTEVSLEDGILKFIYDVKDQKDSGIYPDEMESEDYQEEWKYFKSSNKRVVEHESLYVKQPKYNTIVRVESVLSSRNYKKYALAYPKNESLQKLYKQPVVAEFTVIGSQGIVNPNSNNEELSLNYSIVYFDEFGRLNYDTSPKVIEVKQNEAGEVTPYELLKATGLKYEGSHNWINGINEIKGPEPDPIKGIAGGGWKYSVNDIEPDKTIDNYILSQGDRILFYCTYDYKRDRMPKWESLLGENPKEEYRISILNEDKIYRPGQEIELKADVFKDSSRIDRQIIWAVSNGEVAEIKSGKLFFRKPGSLQLRAELKDNSKVRAEKTLRVIEDEKLSIDDVLTSMGSYYSKKDKFSFREALAYNYFMEGENEGLKKINDNFELVENDTTADLAGNIIGIIAAGNNPYNYQGKNYIEILQKSQRADGKFMISNRDDYPSVQAYGLIALDMARASYKENTVDMILSYQNSSGSFDDSGQGIDTDGMVLSALGNHMDDKKVRDSVEKSLNHLENQWQGKNQWSLSALIQGLVAVGEDPQASRWICDGKTPLEELLQFYTREELFENKTANEQAFMALVDAKNKKSVFKQVRINDSGVKTIFIEPITRKLYEKDFVYLNITAKNKAGNLISRPNLRIGSSDENIDINQNGKISFDVSGNYKIYVEDLDSNLVETISLEVLEQVIDKTIESPRQDELIEKDKEYKSKAKIKNKDSYKSTRISFVVCMYEKSTGKLVNYSIVEKEIDPKETVNLVTGTKTSKDGNFFIKTFVWSEEELKNLAG